MVKTAVGIISFLLLVMVSTSAFAQTMSDYFISWEPNPEQDIAGYVVYRSTDPNSGFAAIDSVDHVTFSIIDEGLETGIRYYYRILAKNTSGARSDLSNLVSVMTIPDDAPPATQDLCRINAVTKSGYDTYVVDWETSVLSSGFVQYDWDAVLDSTSTWNQSSYALHHVAALQGLTPQEYFIRALAVDSNNNLTISALSSFIADESPAPLSAPQISIYPYPFRLE